MADEAVSSVVGTVMMLGVTIAVFSGVSLVVLAEVGDSSDSTHADVAILEGDDAVLLRHEGGENLVLQQGRLLINVDGIEVEVPLEDFAGDTDGERLRIGDSLCISCIYPGQEIRGVMLIHNQAVVADHGERGASGAGLLVDLQATNLTFSPAAPWNNLTVTIDVQVTNIGTATAPTSTLRLALDGNNIGDVAVGSLAPGAGQNVSFNWTAVTGTYTLNATADALETITELTEENNVASTPIDVTAGTLDPGAPFEDTDGDGSFVEGTDILLPLSAISDGVHDAGDHGLVIPASIGALSAAAWDIDGNGTHRIHVPLIATSTDILIDSPAGIHVVDLEAARDITIAGSDVNIAGATWNAGEDLRVTASNNLTATGFTGQAALLGYLYAPAGTIAAADINFQAMSSHAYIIGQDVDVTDGTIAAGNYGYAYAYGDLMAERADVSGNWALLLADGDATLHDATATASVLAYGRAGGDLFADRITVDAGDSPTTYAYLAAGDHLWANETTLDAAGLVYIAGAGGVTATDGSWNGRAQEIRVLSQQDIHIERTTLRADTITLNAGDAGNTIHMQDTCFLDNGGAGSQPTVAPDGVGTSGTPACGGLPVTDPGFPYEDTNNNGAYEEGTDNELDPADVQDGEHDAGSHGLIIPESVGTITAGEIDFKAQGDSLIEVDLVALSDDVNLDIDGELTLTGDITTSTNNKDIIIKHDGLVATDINLESRGHITLDGGDTDLTGATLELLTNGKDVTIKANNLDAQDMTVNTRGKFTVDADDVDLDGATITLLQNNEDFDIDANDIQLGATIEARGKFTVTGDTIDLSDLDLDMLTNDKNVAVTADAWLHGDEDTDFEVRGKITFTAQNIRMEGANFLMLTNGKNLDMTATGLIDLDDVTVEIRGHIFLDTDGDIYVQRAVMTGLQNNKDFEFTGDDIHYQDGSFTTPRNLIANVDGTAFAQGASFNDDNDDLDVEPDGAHSGMPANGDFE